MFETLKSGGVLMIPIIACGIFAVYIIVERLYYFSKTGKRDKDLISKVSEDLAKADYNAAEADCISAGTPLSEVARRVVRGRRLEEADLKEVVQVEMDQALTKYEHFLAALGTIANIATMLGLLGTVTGNIRAFGVLGGGGTMGDPTALANAIAEALVTTVGGLTVSIPSLVFHNVFNNMVKHRINQMEDFTTKIMLTVKGKDC